VACSAPVVACSGITATAQPVDIPNRHCDSRADRILLALRAAGRTSMTRTEISERVFNRNLPADSWTPRFGFCINRDMRRSTKKLPADLRVQDGLQSITLYELNELTNTNERTTTHILNLTCGLNCERQTAMGPEHSNFAGPSQHIFLRGLIQPSSFSS
jgi:hypothetical protein